MNRETRRGNTFARALVCLALLPLCAAQLLAQAQTQATPVAYAIQGARIYTLAGPPIENGALLIRDGKIAAVGANVPVPSDAHVIDGKGLEVYPGLFDPITYMGLGEIDQVLATLDVVELGDYNPDLVAATAINPSSAHIDVTRASGVTHVVSVPGIGGLDFSGGSAVLGGQASAIHLTGWTIQDMLIRKSAAMVVNWPTIETRSFDFSTFSIKERPYDEIKREYDKKVNDLSDWLDRARHYAQAMEKGSPQNFQRDLKLEALAPVVEGKLPVLVVAASARDIRNAVNFCAKRNLRMILAGGNEAWKEKDLLKQKSIPVILGPDLRLPDEEDFPYDKPMTQPSELVAAGIPIAFSSFNTAFSRRLAQQAGNAVAYGLPHEEALKAVTVNAAKMLGFADQLGTLEPGKIANLIVTDGDPLEIKTNVRFLFIKGQLTSQDNRQLQLYEQYRKRPPHSTP
ncbi:MAG: amidohydrolase family protein [Candidatus Acidiferrales bacterium]